MLGYNELHNKNVKHLVLCPQDQPARTKPGNTGSQIQANLKITNRDVTSCNYQPSMRSQPPNSPPKP